MSDKIILYPHSKGSSSPFFNVEEILRLPNNEQFEEEVHRHDFFEVFIFFSGQGIHTIDFKEYEIKTFSIHVVAPYQVHSINRNSETTGLVLQFSEGFISNHEIESFLVGFTLQLVNPTTYYSINIETEIKHYLSLFKSRMLVDKIVSHLLISFLHLLKPLFKALTSEEELIDVAYLKLVNENFKQQQKVSFYTNKLGLDVKRLNIATNSSLGMTAKQVINQRRLLESKRLLHYSKLSVKEIAYELGFNSPSHFSAFFHKETKKYPSDF